MRIEHQAVLPEGATGGAAWTRLGRVGLHALGAPFRLLCRRWRRVLEAEALAALDDRTLEDVGLTRDQISRDGERQMWIPLDSSRQDRTALAWLDWR